MANGLAAHSLRSPGTDSGEISIKYKVSLLLAFCGWYGLFYVLPNHFPIWPPRMLPLWGIDQAVPYLPWTGIFYLSDYLLAVVVVASVRNTHILHQFARLAFTVLTICGMFYYFYPTVYPRPALAAEGSMLLVQWMMELIRFCDSPTNCFPSMHIAITSVCAYMTYPLGRKTNVLFWAWGVLVFISTLTTKQHYLVDILGGLAVFVVGLGLEKTFYRTPWARQHLGRRLAPLLDRIKC